MREMPPIRKAEYGFDYINDKEKVEKKKGFSIGALPAAAIGIMIGSTLAGNKRKKEMLQTMKPERKVPVQNYYAQMEAFKKNLGVMFTPMGVTYVMKNGNSNIGLETISSGAMNNEMKDAFVSKDAEYFKKIMLLKMYSDINLAEQMMAKKIIEKELSLTNSINKKASISIDISDISNTEMSFHVDYLNKLAGVSPDTLDKLIKYADEDTDSDMITLANSDLYDDFSIIRINEAFDKEASFSLSGSVRKIIDPIMNKFNNVKIAFLPDRVIFLSGNIVIHTLSIKDMNLDDVEKFYKRDSSYFMNYFDKEKKKGEARIFGTSSSVLEKKAAEANINDIFRLNNIHPVIYHVVMMIKYGKSWIDFSPIAIPKILEKDFNLKFPICDCALNKLFSIQILNRTEKAFSNVHAFEKIIRAFNDKPIDFEQRESDILPTEIAFAIDVMNRVTPVDNIYDNFSEYVHEYIMDCCMKSNVFYFSPTVVDSKEEEAFLKSINNSIIALLEEAPDSEIGNAKDMALESAAKVRMLHFFMDSISKKVKENRNIRENVGSFIQTALQKFDIPDTTKEFIKNQASQFVSTEDILDTKEDILMSQIIEYRLEAKE